MKTAKLISLSAAALMLSGAFAFAQVPGQHMIDTWDSNSDGKVTLEEVKERRDNLFASFDANTDGFMDSEESKMMDEMRENEQKTMQEEGGMMGGQGKMKGQGMGQGMGQGKGPGNGMGQGMGKGHGMMGKGMGMFGMGREDHAGMDTDGDGKISKAEFTGQSEPWFTRFDRDGDGAITAKDF